MPIPDKVAAAKKISELLNVISPLATSVCATRSPSIRKSAPTASGSGRKFWSKSLARTVRWCWRMAANCCAPLSTSRSEMLRLAPDEHEKISFDCQNFRSARLQELRLAADVAAERVRETGMPYAFAPMSSRERRILHLAMRELDDLRTESDGEAAQRHVVVYPKDYKGKPPAPPISRRRR